MYINITINISGFAAGIHRKKNALVSSPLWVGREVASRFTKIGQEERAKRMKQTAQHESGHAIVHLLTPHFTIVGYRISRMRDETIRRMGDLVDGLPLLDRLRPLHGYLVVDKAEPERVYYQGKEAEHLMYGDLGGLAAQHGMEFGNFEYHERWFQNVDDFKLTTENIRRILHAGNKNHSDRDIFQITRSIIVEIARVFSLPEYKIAIDTLTDYFVKEESYFGEDAHAKLKQLIEKIGLDANARKQMLIELEKIEIGEYLD